VEENYGDSKLARRFGVTRYPAIFVDDILVATPNDFGFYGKEESETGGRYAPLQSAQSHERFRGDLSRMIRSILSGRKEDARSQARPAGDLQIAALPELALEDLDGRLVSPSDLQGRAVLVEFWATWCPPCHSTLQWLAGVKRRYGDRVTVLTLAVQSDPAKVRAIAAAIDAPFRWAMSSAPLARAFGDVSALPTLFLFDQKGRAVASFFGAPPTLRAEVEEKVSALLD
jgi:thiol-disulfide isomerase/thioredoxin